MADSYVRSLGRAETIDGNVGVGVDYDSVSLEYGRDLIRMTRAQAEQFARLFVAACWEAGVNAAQMAAEARDG